MPDSASRSAQTEGLRDRKDRSPDEQFGSGTYADYRYASRYPGYPEYDSYADYGDDGYLDYEYDEYDEYDEYGGYGDYDFAATPLDRRWLWVAGAAGAILLVAVICTMVILGGGDSGSVASPASSPATTSATAPPQDASAPAPPPVRSLPPETITTVTPSPSATAPTTPAPAETAPSPAPAEPAPPAAQTITYQVDGNRQFVDLVTVIYSDHRGALQTEVNVALPWTKTVVLDPGVELSSVTATSMAGQLNCSITDGAGATLAQQSANTMIASCTK